MRPISFGTDGWRGIISFDFTFPRAVTVAEAVRRYLGETGFSERPVLIGYDNRFLAREFAANTANYLKSVGQQVIVFNSAVPTPVCAFGVLHRKAAGALMFTASHNPFYYLGIKFIPHFAGPAETDTTMRITEIIRELEKDELAVPALNTNWDGETADLREEYYSHLDAFINSASLNNIPSSLIFASFHGVGAGWVDGYLMRHGVAVSALNAERDVLFGGRLPDPSPSNLEDLRSSLQAPESALIFATDGDADRFGFMSASGTYYGCNQILPLLADFLISKRGKEGSLVRTVATSHTLDRVAVSHGALLLETPVGFKYVGKALREGALIGGEESGGLSVAGHVPEKDAILSILMVLDLLATTGASLPEVWREFTKSYGHSHFERLDLEIEGEHKEALISDVEAKLSSTEFAGMTVAATSSIDGSKFIFTDGSWALFRPSGTEAVVRVYMESPSEGQFASLKKAVASYLKRYACP